MFNFFGCCLTCEKKLLEIRKKVITATHKTAIYSISSNSTTIAIGYLDYTLYRNVQAFLCFERYISCSK